MDLEILRENPELAKSVKLEICGADLLAFGESIYRSAIVEAGKIKTEREEYMTSQQFADALQISLVSLWTWDKKGITQPLRIGNMKRYRRSDLEKILQQK